MGEYKKPKFIAVPTTSGTGSEVTSYAVVTTKDKKIPLSDSEMLPDIAILNPEFIKTLPIKEWQKEKIDLHKIPAIFVLGQ